MVLQVSDGTILKQYELLETQGLFGTLRYSINDIVWFTSRNINYPYNLSVRRYEIANDVYKKRVIGSTNSAMVYVSASDVMVFGSAGGIEMFYASGVAYN